MCRWRALTRGEAADIGGGGGSSALDSRRARADRRPHDRRPVHILYIVGCSNTTTLRYVPTGITAGDLIPGVLDIARGRVQPPIPDINPPAEAGGIVNLGLWLAVEPATLAPISAEAGPAWITVSPEHTRPRFDFGNGDTVTCDGAGTPITDLDTVDAGPVRLHLPPVLPDDQPYQLTITTTGRSRTPRPTAPAHSHRSPATSRSTTTSTRSRPSASTTDNGAWSGRSPAHCRTEMATWQHSG